MVDVEVMFGVTSSNSVALSPFSYSYLTVDNAPEPEMSWSPFTDRNAPPSDPSTSEHDFDNAGSDGEEPPTELPVRSLHSANARRPIRRSASDVPVASRGRERDYTTSSVHAAVRFQEDENHSGIRPPPQTPTSPHPPRLTTQRSTSNSEIELRSPYHDPNISSASLQEQLTEQTRRPLRPCRPQCVPTEIEPLYSASRRSHEPEADPLRHLVKSKVYDTSVTLKPCMKKKAKSDTPTSPNETKRNFDSSATKKTLRRVKTVDFEGMALKPLLSIPALTIASKGFDNDTTHQANKRTAYTGGLKKNIYLPLFCPGTKITAKSSPADPAVTRTAVHVVAIAPSWNVKDVPSEGGIDPATPTMQIVESKNGRHEIVWDDVPAEHNIRRGRRSSSASHALKRVGSSSIRGLERVNTKLSDWSGTWNSPSESFKPTIVVFPDDDGRTP